MSDTHHLYFNPEGKSRAQMEREDRIRIARQARWAWWTVERTCWIFGTALFLLGWAGLFLYSWAQRAGLL